MPEDEDAGEESGDSLDGADDWLEEFGEAGQVDPAFYAHGGVSLSDAERDALGDLQGKRVLVLQAGNGEDVLSLHNLGAQILLVDDQESLQQALRLANEAGIAIESAAADPQVLPRHLRTRDWDIVYSGFGAVEWLDDLSGWASGIADCLHPYGRLVIYDEHPFARVFGEFKGQLLVSRSYFGEMDQWDDGYNFEDDPDLSEDARGAIRHDLALIEERFKDAPPEPEVRFTLGELVSALGNAGLAVVAMREFPEADRFETVLDTLLEVSPAELSNLPAAMLLAAIKL